VEPPNLELGAVDLPLAQSTTMAVVAPAPQAALAAAQHKLFHMAILAKTCAWLDQTTSLLGVPGTSGT